MPLEQLSRTNTGVGWIANLDAMLMGLILSVMLMMAAAVELARTRRNAHVLDQEVVHQHKVIGDMKRLTEEQRLRLEAANLRIYKIENENSQLKQRFVEVPKQIEALLKLAQDREKHLRQELLGIKARNGKLDRVVFVIDRSGSMMAENRWGFVHDTIRDWVKYLPFREASFVVFNDEITQFPKGHLYITVEPEGINLLDTYLSSLHPEGATNTLKALQTAFRYRDANAIILFTDGQPTTSSAEQVLTAVSQRNVQVPINVVGLGDYFKERKFGKFLQSLAERSGGVFIGK
jgi:Mg-chelatase subunit ChlD